LILEQPRLIDQSKRRSSHPRAPVRFASQRNHAYHLREGSSTLAPVRCKRFALAPPLPSAAQH